jgi:site-specific DNA recombinase
MTMRWHVMENIKQVAIYLRKSRDETDGKEDVLAKHESLLLEYAQKHNLKYDIYKEIGNSEYIDSRPEMVRLLKDVELDLFDAVLVVDIDRLSRGDDEERGRLKRVFRESATYVITPTRMYDFNNSDEALRTTLEMVFANYEYTMIIKRMVRGKKQGAKAGKWTNGTPPFPYVYNRVTRELDVDPEKEKVYRLMISLFLDHLKPSYEIAWELNRLELKTNRNAKFSENAVHRILTSEVHLGKVIFGKTTGSGHKSKPKSNGVKVKEKNEWIVAEGSHRPIKTEDEHQRILALLDKRRLRPIGTRHNIQVLSKLIYCGKCKKCMSFLDKRTGKVYIKPCSKADHLGNRCKNSGMNMEILYAQLFHDLEAYEKQLFSNNIPNEIQDNSILHKAITIKQEELIKLESGIDRIKDSYFEGDIEKSEMKFRTEKLEKKIQAKREEIRSFEQTLAITETDRTDEERIDAITRFKEAWDLKAIDKIELNKLAKLIIDRIEVIRDGDNIEISMQFL